MKVYKCGNCDNEVKHGARFCDECGTKLEWPEDEKVKKVRVVKTKKKAKKAKLDVDPIKVEKLNKECIWVIVILIIGCALSQDWTVGESWIIPLLLIGGILGGIVTSPIFYLRIGIIKWLKSVKYPDNNPEYPTKKMLGKAKGLIIYAAITGALVTLSLIGTLVMPEKPKNTINQTDNASQKNSTVTWDFCYLVILGGLAFEAYKVIESSKNDEKYIYDPNIKQEKETTQVVDNTKAEIIEDLEDEDDC